MELPWGGGGGAEDDVLDFSGVLVGKGGNNMVELCSLA